VPAVGLPSLGVDRQYHLAGTRQRRVRPGDLTEQPRELELVGVRGVPVIPEEHHPVPQQRRAQLGNRDRIDVAAHPDAADDSPDHAPDLRDVNVPEWPAVSWPEGAVL
jgi:hypothetical protein